MMRRFNAWISAAVIALFLFHMISGMLILMGLMKGGNPVRSACSLLLAVFASIHAVIGVILTADTLRLQKKSGAVYFRGNELFYARRLSGGALMILIIWHVLVFRTSQAAPVRLHAFEVPQLIGSILMMAALFVHILSNIRPLIIGFGVSGGRTILKDVLCILAAALFVAAAAFIVYYLRWNVLWRPK